MYAVVPAEELIPENWRVVGEGTPAQIRASERPVVHQFVHGEPDGPVPFHYPAPEYDADVGLANAEVAHA